MQRLLIFILTLTCGVTLHTDVQADDDEMCLPPDPPGIPSGRRSTEEEMQNALQAAKDYVTANDKFRACLKKQVDAAGDAVAPKTLEAANRLYDESFDMDETVVEMINREVRIFKSLNE